jgi:Ni/Fe-hydrogenase 1 B-type cytochrome subunit
MSTDIRTPGTPRESRPLDSQAAESAPTDTQSLGSLMDMHHPGVPMGRTIAVYVWQYPLRLVHWGIVLSIGVPSVTGYYIHDPYIVGQVNPFLMGQFRFVHECFAMLFTALFVLRMYLFFAGNRWMRWRNYVPYRKEQFQEMVKMAKFYLFIKPHPVSKIGHNAMAAMSYAGLYAMVLAEILTGMVMYNVLRHSAFLGLLVGWIPGFINIGNIRLIHFVLMWVFIAFGILHVHLAMLVSGVEKKGLMDSIFIGYKVIPEKDLKEDEEHFRELGQL